MSGLAPVIELLRRTANDAVGLVSETHRDLYERHGGMGLVLQLLDLASDLEREQRTEQELVDFLNSQRVSPLLASKLLANFRIDPK